MAIKFHINPATNKPGRCHASGEGGRGCPFGGADVHFNSFQEAYDEANRRMSNETQPLVGLSKTPKGESPSSSAKITNIYYSLNKSVKGAARSLMDDYGAKSYDEVISNAKDRAKFASKYFSEKESAAKSELGKKIFENATPAPENVASISKLALAARGKAAQRIDGSFLEAHASVSTGATETKAALNAAKSYKAPAYMTSFYAAAKSLMG